MAEHKGRASVRVGGPVDVPKPSKAVAEMSDEEKAKLREKVNESLETAVSSGGRHHVDIEIDSEPYKGRIRMFRPTIDEDRQIGIRATKYLQGAVGVDLKTDNLTIFLATFDVCVDWDSAPGWFDPRKMPSTDYTLLEYVYGRWATWVASFRKFVPPKPEGDSKTPEGAGEMVDTKDFSGSTD